MAVAIGLTVYNSKSESNACFFAHCPCDQGPTLHHCQCMQFYLLMQQISGSTTKAQFKVKKNNTT